MDFLDPRKKRAHKIRLMLGYVLVTIAIGLATVILVYGAYGYGIDTKTGEIVQNGLLFVDSKPGNAGIYLNGKYQNSTTNARLVLPAKDYNLTLKKAGYRDWQRKFTLDEHSIERFVYPFLYPTQPVTATLKSYPSAPALLTQSPDRRWLLVQNTATKTFTFDEFDTSSISQPPRSIALTQSLFATTGGTLSEVEWSSDNNQVLLKHTYPAGLEYIILDRREPAKSVNLNKLFKINPAQVALHNKQVNKVYLYDQQLQTLRLGGLGNGALEPVLLTQVLAFKPYGSNLLSYVTDKQTPADEVAARIWENGKSYPLSTFPAGDRYLIDAAQFQGHWYYVAASNKTDRLNIFKDPLSDLKNASLGKALPDMVLRLEDAAEVKFSINTRFLAAQSGQRVAVYDFEAKKRYQYTTPVPAKSLLSWMDGHRLISSSVTGQVAVFDYDSTNRQELAPTSLNAGGYFSNNYNYLFTVSPTTASGEATLQAVDMRAGSDLPRNPQN